MRKYYYTNDIVLKASEEALSGMSVPTRYDTHAEEFSEIDVQITYKFTSDERVNMFPVGNKSVSYGSPNMTFRNLYELLVNKFNHGEYFIERYFSDVYPSTVKYQVQWKIDKIKKEYHAELAELTELAQGNIAKSTGLPDKRFTNTADLLKFVANKNKLVQQKSDEIAQIIRQDLRQCFTLGLVGLKFKVSAKTLARRKRAGLDSIVPIVASGQLIDNVLIFLRFEVD